MCPNFVQMVLGLMVVAHEQSVDLDVIDLVCLCVVKTNLKHDLKCFYLSKAAGNGVISALPSKDKYRGRRYFYFIANEHSLGDRPPRFKSKWASSPSMPIKLMFIVYIFIGVVVLYFVIFYLFFKRKSKHLRVLSLTRSSHFYKKDAVSGLLSPKTDSFQLDFGQPPL